MFVMGKVMLHEKHERHEKNGSLSCEQVFPPPPRNERLKLVRIEWEYMYSTQ